MCYFKLDDFLKWSMQSNHMLIIWKNQEKHCWTCLKPLSVICGCPIPHYLDYSHILQRRRKPVSNILPYSKLQFLFYDFFSKQQSETDAVRIGVSYNRARLFYKMWSFLSSNFTFSSSKPNSEKNWPSFSFKAFGYARVLALQSAKKSNFGKF